jgi:hypothetical protein
MYGRWPSRAARFRCVAEGPLACAAGVNLRVVRGDAEPCVGLVPQGTATTLITARTWFLWVSAALCLIGRQPTLGCRPNTSARRPVRSPCSDQGASPCTCLCAGSLLGCPDWKAGPMPPAEQRAEAAASTLRPSADNPRTRRACSGRQPRGFPVLQPLQAFEGDRKP